MKREPFWRRYDRFFGVNRRQDAEDELAFHIEMRVRDYMTRGLAEPAARRAAKSRIGDLEGIRRDVGHLADSHTRVDQRREWLSELRQDVAYGARTLVRSPAFASVAVLTMALGIGATTAIFSVVNRVLIAPLPYADAGRLVQLYERAPEGRNDENPVSGGNYTDWLSRARSFSTMGAYGGTAGMAMTGDGEPEQIWAATLTPSAMTALGVRPLIGRPLTAADDETGGVVVLSEGFWHRRFGGDSTVLGRALTLNGVSHTAVGVLSRDVEFPTADVDVWRPLTRGFIDPAQRRSHNFNVIARLAPGVTLSQAQSEMNGIARGIATEHPQYMAGWGVSVEGLRADLVEDARPLLVVLAGAVAVVLLIACANLAGLLMARAVAREREMVLRRALGAGRARLIRQLLTESLLIAGIGGTLALVTVGLSLTTLLGLAPPIPLADQTRADWTLVAFAASATIVSAFVFGLVPAIRLSRADVHSALRAVGGATGRRRDARARGALIVAQIAMSVALLVSAGLLVRSFQRLQAVDLGFAPDGLSVVSIDLPRSRYQSTAHQVAFHDALVDRVGRIQGVRSVAGTSITPTATPSTWSFAIEGRQASNPSGREEARPIHFVTADYFKTLRIPLRTGREFAVHDHAAAPRVVIVNEALARLHWPQGDAIGKRISLTGAEGPWTEIVGVVGDTRMAGPDADPVPAMYMPYAQKTFDWMSWMNIVVRADAGADAAAFTALRAAVRDLDRQVPVRASYSVIDLYRDTIARRTFAMQLVTAFGLLALVLSVVGLYGLVSYTVAQQRREIGVRMALGADPSAVLNGVLARSLRLVAIGVVAGLVASFAATRTLTALLYGTSPLDPVAFVGSAIAVVAVSLIAAGVPAVRAARTPPLSALRG